MKLSENQRAIKILVDESHYTIRELSAQSKLHCKTISRWINGWSEPRVHNITKVKSAIAELNKKSKFSWSALVMQRIHFMRIFDRMKYKDIEKIIGKPARQISRKYRDSEYYKK